MFSLEEQKLFTRALEVSEKKGKTIHLAIAAATDRWEAIVRAAQSLRASTVVLGASPTSPVAEEARLAGVAWEHLPEPRQQLTLGIIFPTGEEHVFYLGPHAPHLTSKEIDLLHSIWLEVSGELAPAEVHHHDIVHFALDELQTDLSRGKRDQIMAGLRTHVQAIRGHRVRKT